MFPRFRPESRLGGLRGPSNVESLVTLAPSILIRTEIAAFAVKTNLRLINQTSELRTWRRQATEDKRGRTDTQSTLTLPSSSSSSLFPLLLLLLTSYNDTFAPASSSLANKTCTQQRLTFPARLSKTDSGHTSCKNTCPPRTPTPLSKPARSGKVVSFP